MINDHELRTAINAQLESPLSDSEWLYLDSRPVLRRCRIGEMSVAGVAAEVQQMRAAVTGNRAVSQRQPILLSKDRGGETTPARVRAISELVSREAEQDTEVMRFRLEALKGELVSQSAVDRWIGQQAHTDGKATMFVTVRLPDDCRLDLSDDGLIPSRPLTVEKNWPASSAFLKELQYGLNGHVHRVPVAAGGVLDRLRVLSERLSQRYRWQPAQAAIFVLTGAIPIISTFQVTYAASPISALARVTLTIDPAMSPREVSEYYRRARKRFVGSRHRSMSDKHTTLVLFMMSRPSDETYAQSMTAWNKQYRKWKYRHPTNFGRDVQVARQRLLGSGPDQFRPLEISIKGDAK